MTLQEQVCTLEQAKRLEELGCEQGKSPFYWYTGDTGLNQDYLQSRLVQVGSRIGVKHDKADSLCFDAYTGAELGEMLVNIDFDLINLIHYSGANGWLMYVNHSTTTPSKFHTEAQARAALLIHRLEKEKANGK